MTDHPFPRRATQPERPLTSRLKSRRSPSLIGNGLLLLCSALATTAGPGGATDAYAAPQDPSGFGGAGGTALANEVIEFKGTLKDARGNMVTVAGDDGTEYIVQYPDEITSLEFIAKALPAYLRRGMPIRFATVLGPTGMPMAPVNQIEVFAPINAKMLPHNQTERYTPGVHPADRKKRPRGAPLTGKVIVVGNLAMLNAQGGLALQAGSTPVQTMVAPDASLEIRVNNLSLAQPGDAVSVEGFYQPPDKTKVKANRIKITTDRIYGETPPKKIRQRPGKKTSDASPDTPDDAATPQNETAENETAKNEEAPDETP